METQETSFRGLVPAFAKIRELLSGSGPDIAVSGLLGAALPLGVAEVILARKGPLLVVVPDGTAAGRLAGDLQLFLAGTGHAERPVVYPPFDVAPFESISPHPSILAARMSAMARLVSPRSDAVVIAPVGALLKRMVPKRKLLASSLELRVGDDTDRDIIILALEESGYGRVSLVEDVGEYAVRGGVVDFWSPLSADPVRIELFGDEIRSIRTFSPTRQATIRHVDRALISLCREVIFEEGVAERFAARIKPLADSQNVDRKVRDRFVEEVEAKIHAPGIEFLLPLFYESLDTIASYLPSETTVVTLNQDLCVAMAGIEDDLIAKRHEAARAAGKLCAEPRGLFMSPDDLFESFDSFRNLSLGGEAVLPRGKGESFRFQAETLSGLREEILARAQDEKMLEPLTRRLTRWINDGYRVVLAARSASGIDRLRRLLEGYGFSVITEAGLTMMQVLSRPPGTRVPLLTGELSAGAVIPHLQTAIVTEEEIFGPRRHAETYRGKRGEPIADFSDLAEGDAVVHLTHGIGIFKGLSKLSMRGLDGEFLHLEYADGDKLYVPVDRLSQVHRFIGTGSFPVVDKLGGTGWERTKDKARVSIQKLAKELLALYAKRETQPGHAFPPGREQFSEFEATFPYDETPDQLSAIGEVIGDMTSAKPMDRLISGDVGFGKTEVALRAAFLAVLDGKQVAVLVPTTTLAFQHGRTFAGRMSPFGVNVRTLSRFVGVQERRKIKEEAASGLCDVLIGTHQILGKAIKFRDLGLLVVDEEQHFGVAQKEKIKSLKELVDVIAMSATPIPRTLHMSLLGIRDLSIINTPPEDRLSVRTFITRWDDDTIREAISRELSRGGQIFFVHNRIQSIHGIAERVQRLAPKARVRVGHGQMEGDEIERLLIDFYEHRFDILVSTTIVGSGLDFPQANTMFIHRADMLGLSQLYQLRGRVGRSKVRAYCYLIVPAGAAVSADARRRLAAIRTFTELGSGYKIAAKDLEIRGAGNLLGQEQSGHIAAVGYELYRELLDDETRRLRGETVDKPVDTEINLPIPAFIPEGYIEEAPLRLATYKKIADSRDIGRLDSLRDEAVDRFGALPKEVENLFLVMRIKLRAQRLGIKAIDYGRNSLIYSFDERTPIGVSKLVELVTIKNNEKYRLLPDGKLLEKVGSVEVGALTRVLGEGLITLELCVNNPPTSDSK